MKDEHEPSAEDRARLERYLQWRERTERAPRRRWRPRSAVIIVAVGVVAVGLLTRLPRGPRDTGTPAALTSAIERAPAAERPAAPVRPTTPTVARTPRRSAAPDDVRVVPREATPPAALPPATSDLVAAGKTPVDRTAPEPAAETMTSDTAPPPTLPPSKVEESAGVIAPGSAAAAVARPACPDLAAMTNAGSAPDGRSRSQRVVECVGGWVKGEAQEFRDGIKRGVEDVRAGVDRMGRELQRLGSKLRRSE